MARRSADAGVPRRAIGILRAVRWLFRCHAVAALWVLVASLADAAGLALEGRVVAVHDGDTVTVLDDARVQHRVRIAGIDAPERGQPFGASARDNLAHLVHGRRVAARCHKRDRFGRAVCAVFVGARDVGLEQVRDGLAWWYRDYASEQRLEERATYAAAEGEARSSRRGLWRDPHPQAPWAWRRQSGAGRKAAPA
jgi:endonuclease YncB( thermonuclease family)